MAANHWFAVAADGRIYMVKGDWNEKFLGQLDGFTQVAHDDRVTSITGAMNWLSPFKAWAKTSFMSLQENMNTVEFDKYLSEISEKPNHILVHPSRYEFSDTKIYIESVYGIHCYELGKYVGDAKTKDNAISWVRYNKEIKMWT